MKVKLQKHFAYKYEDRKHYKRVIVISEEANNQLRWKAGQELKIEVNNAKLTIRANQSQPSKNQGKNK